MITKAKNGLNISNYKARNKKENLKICPVRKKSGHPCALH